VVDKLRKVHLDAPAGADVEQPADLWVGMFLPERDPSPRVEPAVQDAARPRVRGAPPPRTAHGSEANVVGHIVGEDELGDKPRRAIAQIRPVPAALVATQIGFESPSYAETGTDPGKCSGSIPVRAASGARALRSPRGEIDMRGGARAAQGLPLPEPRRDLVVVGATKE
jgi:hypothetical protein